MSIGRPGVRPWNTSQTVDVAWNAILGRDLDQEGTLIDLDTLQCLLDRPSWNRRQLRMQRDSEHQQEHDRQTAADYGPLHDRHHNRSPCVLLSLPALTRAAIFGDNEPHKEVRHGWHVTSGKTHSHYGTTLSVRDASQV